METFLITLNVGVDTVDKVRELVISYINKVDYLETESYEVNKGKLIIEVVVRKSDILKLDRFIHKVVSDNKVNNYEFKKISESKLEDNEEL